MKTFAYKSQTNLLGKRVAFMKQLIAANCGNRVRVNTRCCLHLRVSAVVNVGRMPAGPHNNIITYRVQGHPTTIFGKISVQKKI